MKNKDKNNKTSIMPASCVTLKENSDSDKSMKYKKYKI